MKSLENFLQESWAASQVCAEQNMREKNENNASFYAGQAKAYQNVLGVIGLQTNEEIYRDTKLTLKHLLERNQVRGK